MIEIHQVIHVDELDAVAHLFDKYRIFYKQASDIQKGRKFLQQLFQRDLSIVFCAKKNEECVGFTQLFKTYSSVNLVPFLILNDLFVIDEHRKQGVATTLLQSVKEFCKMNDFHGIYLETAIDNPAQKLYEKMHWKQTPNTLYYYWNVP
ncbi:MAG: GNAT family N-acetyltransferase [Flavobacterium sp.]|nr:MAG: GNAT family N-acetyltransferase [Flavobacterium sp.]